MINRFNREATLIARRPSKTSWERRPPQKLLAEDKWEAVGRQSCFDERIGLSRGIWIDLESELQVSSIKKVVCRAVELLSESWGTFGETSG